MGSGPLFIIHYHTKLSILCHVKNLLSVDVVTAQLQMMEDKCQGKLFGDKSTEMGLFAAHNNAQTHQVVR